MHTYSKFIIKKQIQKLLSTFSLLQERTETNVNFLKIFLTFKIHNVNICLPKYISYNELVISLLKLTITNKRTHDSPRRHLP